MELYIAIAGILITVITFVWGVFKAIRKDQIEYRKDTAKTFAVLRNKIELNELNIKHLKDDQDKFETRIEAQLDKLQSSFKQLNDLIIEKFLK